MITNLIAMIRDEEAATMVEYGLLVALIALVASWASPCSARISTHCSTPWRAPFNNGKKRSIAIIRFSKEVVG